MIIVCAWCKQEQSRDDREPKSMVSHTCCDKCRVGVDKEIEELINGYEEELRQERGLT